MAPGDSPKSSSFYIRTNMPLQRPLHLSRVDPSAIAPKSKPNDEAHIIDRTHRSNNHVSFPDDPDSDDSISQEPQEPQDPETYPLVLDGGFNVQISSSDLDQAKTRHQNYKNSSVEGIVGSCKLEVSKKADFAKHALHEGWSVLQNGYYRSKLALKGWLFRSMCNKTLGYAELRDVVPGPDLAQDDGPYQLNNVDDGSERHD